MTLTAAEQVLLKTYIENDATLNAFPNTPDGAAGIAVELNKQESPDFTVWRTAVGVQEIMTSINGVSVAGLTAAESNVLIAVIASFQNSGVDTSVVDKRQLFDDLFTGGANNNPTTRDNLQVLWRRLALAIETVFSTGVGSDAVPANLGRQGVISGDDVEIARNSV